MPKDYTARTNAAYVCNGASNHSVEERQGEDYYATEPKNVEMLLELEKLDCNILEPCCGEGHISKVLEDAGHKVTSYDLYDRGYGEGGHDFLGDAAPSEFHGDIVTNPPYKFAREFVEKALSIVPNGNKVVMFLKLTFLEGKGRESLFTLTPPRRIWVSRSRLRCGKNGEFNVSSAVAYAWFVWEKGWKGDPVIKWFN